MKLFNDGDRSTTTTLAANVAQVSRRVWLGWSVPRMPWPSKPDIFYQISCRMAARNQRVLRQRRSVLDAIGIQLSALPPPVVRPVAPLSVSV